MERPLKVIVSWKSQALRKVLDKTLPLLTSDRDARYYMYWGRGLLCDSGVSNHFTLEDCRRTVERIGRDYESTAHASFER